MATKKKEGNLVTFVAKVKVQRYYKDGFGIYVVEPTGNKDKVKVDKDNQVVISGNVGNSLIPELEYIITGKEVVHPRFGLQYQVSSIMRQSKTDGVSDFLYAILPKNQVDTLLDVYPNIVSMIMKNETIDFSKTKGIKEASFEKIKEKIFDNYAKFDLLVTYGDTLTQAMLDKILKVYTQGTKQIKSLINTNPYQFFTSLSGVGFKTADGLILALEDKGKIVFDQPLRTSIQRMYKAIEYILEQNESSGNTCMDLKEIREECAKLTPECMGTFVECIKNVSDKVYLDKEHGLIGLKRTRDKELFIYNKLNKMNKMDNIWDIIDIENYREVDGRTLTDEQFNTAKLMSEKNAIVLVGSGGCVDKDTEYFNGREWKKISEFEAGDKVLQYNSQTGYGELVYPSKYHKIPCEELWHFKTKYGLDQCLSDDHDVVYESSKGNLVVKQFKKVKEMHENSKGGFGGKFLTTFSYNGKGIDLTDEEIRVMCAVICDGSFENNTNHCRINLKKNHKKERLEMLLHNANIDFKKKVSSAEGYHVYYFYSPIRTKIFNSYWYDCTQEQLKVICDEILFWDGSTKDGRMRFSTTIKQSADFIQFAFSSCGYRCMIRTDDRKGQEYFTCGKLYTRKSVYYELSITSRNKCSIGGFHSDEDKTQINKYKTLDGYKYCFTVDSEMLILRRNDRIFITSNCGKSMSMMSFVKACDNSNISYSLCSPTGKASKVMSNYTGKEAKTIHRLLEYNPDNLEEYGSFFKYNANNKLPVDLIIIDEFGMCDVDLFYNLLLAIDENRTKLLIIGDDGQLPSVGSGNVLHDLIHLNIVPINRLTKVFRYKEGGLSKACEDNRNGIPYLEAIKSNSTKVLGNNKDFIHMERYDTPSTLKCIEDCFTNLIKKYPIEDVVILVAQNKGDLGTVNINKRLQTIYHKGKTGEKFLMMGEGNKFIEGDKVVQNKNNYRATSYPNKGQTSVFNGNTGTIISIHFDEIVIDFDGEMVIYNKEDMTNVSLAYAMTVHKAQGSQCKNVVLCLPKAHTFMLNSNIIYTGESRTSWRCFIVGNLMTINRAIKKRANLSRNTWLSIM